MSCWESRIKQNMLPVEADSNELGTRLSCRWESYELTELPTGSLHSGGQIRMKCASCRGRFK